MNTSVLCREDRYKVNIPNMTNLSEKQSCLFNKFVSKTNGEVCYLISNADASGFQRDLLTVASADGYNNTQLLCTYKLDGVYSVKNEIEAYLVIDTNCVDIYYYAERRTVKASTLHVNRQLYLIKNYVEENNPFVHIYSPVLLNEDYTLITYEIIRSLTSTNRDVEVEQQIINLFDKLNVRKKLDDGSDIGLYDGFGNIYI